MTRRKCVVVEGEGVRTSCKRAEGLPAVLQCRFSINQDDVEERNHQVQQMRAIYKGAEQVDVWLGLGSHANRRAFDFLQRLVRDGVEK